MKKSKRSQKKRKRLSGGTPEGQQRQPRPVLSDEDYPQQPEFDPTAGAPQRRQTGRGGSSPQPGRNLAGSSQRPAQRGQNPGRPQRQPQAQPSGRQPQINPNEAPRQDPNYVDDSQTINRPQETQAAGSFRAMKRTGAGKRRPSGPRPSSVETGNPIPAQPADHSALLDTSTRSNVPSTGPSGAPSLIGEHTQAFQRVNPTANQEPVPRQRPIGEPASQSIPQFAPGTGPNATAPNVPAAPNAAHTPGTLDAPSQMPPVANMPGLNAEASAAARQSAGLSASSRSEDIAGSQQQAPLAAKPMNSAAARRTRQEASRLTAEAAAPSNTGGPQTPVGMAEAPTQSAIQMPGSLDDDTGPPTEAFDVTSLSNNPSGQVDAANIGEATTFSPEVAKPMESAVAPLASRRSNPGVDASEGRSRGKKVRKPLPQSGARKAPKKPSEPTKAILAVALSAIVLVGIGVAVFMFLKGGDDPETAAGQDDATAEDEPPVEEEPAASETPASADPTAAQEGALMLVFANEVAGLGPLLAGTDYEMSVSGVNPGASFRYLVDGTPVGESFSDIAPTLSLEPGRQVVALEQTLDGEVEVGNGVAVYVLGEASEQTYRANLKSVNIETEGWAEAVKQFDLLKATHPELKLTPSDPYPSLTPGFWNLYIDGFDSSDAANAYCEEKGLAIPDACFSKLFDPAAPAS